MPEEVKQDGQVEEIQKDEQPQGEEKQPEVMSTSEEPSEEPSKDGELPNGVKERTREQFEKLKAEKEALKKQLEERKNLPSVLDFLDQPKAEVPSEVRNKYIQPQQVQQPQVPVPPYFNPYMQPQVPKQESLTDEQGYVNTDVLEKRLKLAEEAQRKAEEAERRAREAEQRISRFEIDNETKQLYNAYPELDPNSEVFNQDAYDLVRNELTSQLVNSGRRDAMGAAGKMSRYFRKQPEQIKQEQVLEQRQQVVDSGNQVNQQVDTRPISQLSTAERLKRLGL